MRVEPLQAYRVALWFLCGFLAVLIFHQGAIQMLFKSGIIANGPYQMRAIPPLGVPAIMNQAFWGGMWGIVFGLLQPYFTKRVHPLTIGFAFGILGPTMLGWFVLSPMRGGPVAAGFVLDNMARGIFINGMFGVGVAALLMLAHRYGPKTTGAQI